MLNIDHHPTFLSKIKKIRDLGLKVKIKKQVKKIITNPEIGKPMKHARKGTRELHVKPFRLSYVYLVKENKIVFLDIYHKDGQ